jgi:hypothetical protein
VEDPVTPCRNQLGNVRDLIDSYKPDAKCTGRICLAAFVTSRDVAEPMKVASVIVLVVRLPRALARLDMPAIAEHAIVIDNECFFSNVETHGRRSRRVVGILN